MLSEVRSNTYDDSFASLSRSEFQSLLARVVPAFQVVAGLCCLDGVLAAVPHIRSHKGVRLHDTQTTNGAGFWKGPNL
jgi:hypothetical protein